MFITEENGYIVAFGKPENETESKEYIELKKIMNTKPKAEEGFDYRLKSDLTWELFKLPEVTETEKEKAVTEYEP